jgi:hypothetical protein
VNDLFLLREWGGVRVKNPFLLPERLRWAGSFTKDGTGLP